MTTFNTNLRNIERAVSHLSVNSADNVVQHCECSANMFTANNVNKNTLNEYIEAFNADVIDDLDLEFASYMNS